MNHLDDDVIDRLLSPDAPEALRERARLHLRECSNCDARYGRILAMHELLLADAAHRRSAPSVAAPAHSRARVPQWAVAALVLLSLGVGFTAGTRLDRAATPHAGGEYLLVLAGSEAGALPAEARQDIGARFRAWTDSLALREALISQGQLSPGGRWVHGSDPVAAEPPAALHAMNGYYLIRAQDEDEAVRIASASPYLDLRGGILVRTVARSDGAGVRR